MIMEPFEVYRYYLALRLHFTTEKYDAIKMQGRVRASKQAFLRRSDLLSIRKVAEQYSDKDVVDFLVSNFVAGDRWGGVFDVEAKERYTDWKRRIESLQYSFEKDLQYLTLEMEKQGHSFEYCITVPNSGHPYILKSYLRNTTSIETMVILDYFYSYIQVFDSKLKDDIVWPDHSRIIRKYKPFLTINKEKYDRILRRAIGLNAE